VPNARFRTGTRGRRKEAATGRKTVAQRVPVKPVSHESFLISWVLGTLQPVAYLAAIGRVWPLPTHVHALNQGGRFGGGVVFPPRSF
jgi:hypothetical protein